MKILLTGANGFVGKRLALVLQTRADVELTTAVRCEVNVPAAKSFKINSLDENTNWFSSLEGRQVVIHAAGVAHAKSNRTANVLAEYRRVNVDGTLNLMRQAAIAGVERFIFISSIGVNGTTNTSPFTEEDEPNPADPYAQSKWEAEQGLWKIRGETGIELVIIRPPLVYGYNAPGNFGTLIRWISKGLPLPLGAIRNQRSLVGIDNLVDLIYTCVEHPRAANQLFLAGDGEDVSTTELLEGVAKAMGRSSRLVSLPVPMIEFVMSALGKNHVFEKVAGSLRIDISKARSELGWVPPVSVEEGLRRCFEYTNET